MFLSVSFLPLTKSTANPFLFLVQSRGRTANAVKGDGGREATDCHWGYLQVPCTPVQVEVDVFYFPVLGKFVMDVFFGGFLVDSSDEQDPALNSCWGTEGG